MINGVVVVGYLGSSALREIRFHIDWAVPRASNPVFVFMKSFGDTLKK